MLDSDPDLISSVDSQGRTALHWAVDRENVEAVGELISRSSFDNLGIRDIDGCSILHYAVTIESIELVEILVQNRIDLNIEDNDGLTAADYNNDNGNEIIQNILLQGH